MHSIKDLGGTSSNAGRNSASSFRNEKIHQTSKKHLKNDKFTSDKSLLNKLGAGGGAPQDLDNQSMAIHEAEFELIHLRSENEMLKDKVKELEKWLVMLLNNFYEGNPNSLKNIEQGLCKIDELRFEKFGLQKAALLLKKQNIDLQNSFLEYRRQVQIREEEIKKYQGSNDTEKLIIEKGSLEQTLISLSEEVEALSSKNERMLKDLQKKEFYNTYQLIQSELVKLQQAHVALISTISATQTLTSSAHLSGHRHSKSVINTNISPKTSFMCGIERGATIISPRMSISANQTTQNHERRASNSFLSLLSCSGCSPNNPMPGMYKSKTSKYGINDYPMMDEFESLIVQNNQDVNFLCQSERSHYLDNKRDVSNSIESNYTSKNQSKTSQMDSSLIRNVKMTIERDANKKKQL